MILIKTCSGITPVTKMRKKKKKKQLPLGPIEDEGSSISSRPIECKWGDTFAFQYYGLSFFFSHYLMKSWQYTKKFFIVFKCCQGEKFLDGSSCLKRQCNTYTHTLHFDRGSINKLMQCFVDSAQVPAKQEHGLHKCFFSSTPDSIFSKWP